MYDLLEALGDEELDPEPVVPVADVLLPDALAEEPEPLLIEALVRIHCPLLLC